MTTRDPGKPDLSDATIVRPRGAMPGAAPAAAGRGAPPPAAAPRAPESTTMPAAMGEFLTGGSNRLLQAASPLLLLAVQLRNSVSQPDAMHLREQVVAQIRQFEARAQSAGLTPQTTTAARYALCAMLDESVLNTPWGEHSGWAAKTLLVIFHNEAWAGEKFFQILERLSADFGKHLDLVELMYVCLALGFAGRYQIETGGKAKLADIQEDLYRKIRAQRAAPAQELAPHWKGLEDRRNPLVRYVPLWVIAAAGALAVLGAFLIFFTKLNDASAPVSAQLAQIGLESAAPPEEFARPRPVVAGKSLRELLGSQQQSGALAVEDGAGGKALIRLKATGMFASGGTEVSGNQLALLAAVAQALDQVPGRVVVVGHTDDQPLRSLRFKDNFELSAERARSVAAVLAKGLTDPGRIDSSGAGASKPIATPPSTPENRARNRRVEILHDPGS